MSGVAEQAPLSIPPQPSPDEDTRGFWEATRRGELAISRCQDCGLWHQPPLERCRRCAGPMAFEPVAGTGEVYSFIVVRQPAVPGYVEGLPYIPALVELDEQAGLRLPTRLVDVEPSDVSVGLRVRVAFEPLPGGDYMVPVFRPDHPQDAGPAARG